MKYGLKDESICETNSVFKKFLEIEKVVLYGSRDMGNFRDGSDIDITLKGDNIDNSSLYKICEILNDSTLPYKFDISIFDKIEDQNFIDHINRVGVVFYERSN